MNQTTTGVRCGNHQGAKIYHDTAAQVRECYALGATTAGQARDYGQRAAAGPSIRLASPAQVKFLTDLLAGREISDRITPWAESLAAKIKAATLSAYDAHAAIDRLQALPRKAHKPAPAVRVVDHDGMYRNPASGEIYKVQFNKATGSGRALYAKLLVVEREPTHKIPGVPASGVAEPAVISFVYRPGLISKIRPEWRMTLAEAKSFGALYGTCVRCGRTLTLEESIERSMGRVCAGKANWA